MLTASRNGVRSRLAEQIYTYCAFWIAVTALPALAISYVVVGVSKHLWLKLLSSRFPELEFIRTDTVRSLLDTHRNQGIFNVLLSVKGTLDTEKIKNQLSQHVLERRDKNGDLMFPRLRHLLVSCWGNYAWDVNVTFRPENHLMVANAFYRGRPVGENNIQDFVSEIVSKYFSNDQPPWQYIIIPCVSTEPKYYILVRVHHLLLSGKHSINIGDLLLVEQNPTERVLTHTNTQQSPLTKLFPTPSAIPELWGKLNENLSNAWNEFVSEYDPVESPRALKSLPGAFHVAGLVLICGVSALRELNKQTNGRSNPPVTATALIAAVRRECKRRNLTIPKMMISPLVTVDPRKWPKRALEMAWKSTTSVAKLPVRILDEVGALLELKRSGHVRSSHTLTWKYAELGQLCLRASGEAWRGVVEAYRAPAQLWNDTVRADDGKRHLLQSVSLCGRKVTSWSRPIPRLGLERAARAFGVSSTDVALYAATESLRAVLENTHTTPDLILTTARAATQDFLFAFAEGNGRTYKKSQSGGMVCLSLPVGATPRRIASVVGHACSRQGALAGAWAAQARCGALTRAVPSPFARLTLNMLSRRYAVSYAEINSPVGSRQRNTLWGQAVDSVVYWRPPQANISVSLTVIQYADTVRLAIMTDARLSPSHTIPATRWPIVIEQLIAKVDQELAKIATQSVSVTTQAIERSEVVPSIVTTRVRSEQSEVVPTIVTTHVRSEQSEVVPTIVTTHVRSEQSEVVNESEVVLSTRDSGSLRPPSTAVVSPPVRRRVPN